MILSFSKQQFVDRIKSGVKIHTIREDKHNRWKPGMKVHFWFGNPRNTRSKNRPYHFANGECVTVDDIELTKNINVIFSDRYESGEFNPYYDLHINDGFDTMQQMDEWFSDKYPFVGKLIWFKVTEIIQ